MGPPKGRMKQRMITTYAYGGDVACVVIFTWKDN